MYKNNYRSISKFKHCSTFQFSCNLPQKEAASGQKNMYQSLQLNAKKDSAHNIVNPSHKISLNQFEFAINTYF
jgi:hypothetical protein